MTLFEQIAAVCPSAPVSTSDLITVVEDTQVLGKQFTVKQDGSVQKKANVTIFDAVACQFYVPDHATLEKVLRLVAESPNAAVTNCGWKPAAIGQPFRMVSEGHLEKQSKDGRGAYVDKDGRPMFARVKEHATASTWQVLDRDEDKHTPDWARTLDFSNWLTAVARILPGVAVTRLLRTQSASARVIDQHGEACGGGNGHVWLKVANPADVDRTRTAIRARAIELGLSWLKPKYSKKTGEMVGNDHATIIDSAVWSSSGRLLFVGKPTAPPPLIVTPQAFEQIPGERETLDTEQAVISPLRTARAANRLGAPVRVSKEMMSFNCISKSLKLTTELELEDGRVLSVLEAMQDISGSEKLRCQAPFRDSSSFAAFLALGHSGQPFVFDSGTSTKFVLKGIEEKVDRGFEQMLFGLRLQLTDLIGEEDCDAVIDIEALRTAWDRSFIISTNNKVGLLNANDDRIELLTGDAQAFGFRQAFGHFLDPLLLDELIDEIAVQRELGKGERKEFEKTLRGLATTHLLRALKMKRQAKSAEVTVDMFIKRGSVAIRDGVASFSLPHRPFIVKDRPSASIVAQVVGDYYKHFPEFGPFLDLLLHARFAPDRRRAFVWLHANSDFGKGLMASVFKNLGLLFDVSREMIEKVIAGETVGLDPSSIYRCWILHVDEFKAASRELKQLNATMSVTAKYQLATTVDLYVKLFCSAEDVRSLVGDGVETQFNKRFAYVRPPDAAIDDRPLFKSLGKQVYLDALSAHVADYLNDGIERLTALGKQQASLVADAKVDAYQAARQLETKFGSLEVGMHEIASQIRNVLRRYVEWSDRENERQLMGGGRYCSPSEFIGISTSLFQRIRSQAEIGYFDYNDERLRGVRVPNASDFVVAYLEQPGANRSTVGKFLHKAAEIAVLTHMLNKEDGPTGRCRVYQRQAKGPSEVGTRRRGLVVLEKGCDDDLQEPVVFPELGQVRLHPDDFPDVAEEDRF